MIVKWDPERVAHVKSRSARYPGALDLRLSWLEESCADRHAMVEESEQDILRVVGYSAAAGFLITVIVECAGAEYWGSPSRGSPCWGITAWKTTGRDRRNYWEAHHAD